ncbi:hypothetical protein HID58_033551 [Brassica napus]|uniref:Uncharacterized protein n=1 Tax=Brassica napus TaxID=3708 RepID=A0ABQ8BZJ7_BRANA|nr:hypothetical protein HID58_033551 [Brassica napus]
MVGRKASEGENSDTYQCLASATKAGLYIAPHDTLNDIPNEQALASAIYETCTKMAASKHVQESQLHHRRGNKTKPRCRDMIFDEMLTLRLLMTPKNRLSISGF